MKSIYEVATAYNFHVLWAWAKPQKNGGEYSYVRIYSDTWPRLVLTYEGMTVVKSKKMGTINHNLFTYTPDIFSEIMDPKEIPAEHVAEAAKAFHDAKNIMETLKKVNPELPPWEEPEDPEWGDR